MANVDFDKLIDELIKTDSLYVRDVDSALLSVVNEGSRVTVSLDDVRGNEYHLLETEISGTKEIDGVTYWLSCVRYVDEVIVDVVLADGRIVHEIVNELRFNDETSTEIAEYLIAGDL